MALLDRLSAIDDFTEWSSDLMEFSSLTRVLASIARKTSAHRPTESGNDLDLPAVEQAMRSLSSASYVAHSVVDFEADLCDRLVAAHPSEQFFCSWMFPFTRVEMFDLLGHLRLRTIVATDFWYYQGEAPVVGVQFLLLDELERRSDLCPDFVEELRSGPPVLFNRMFSETDYSQLRESILSNGKTLLNLVFPPYSRKLPQIFNEGPDARCLSQVHDIKQRLRRIFLGNLHSDLVIHLSGIPFIIFRSGFFLPSRKSSTSACSVVTVTYDGSTSSRPLFPLDCAEMDIFALRLRIHTPSLETNFVRSSFAPI